MLDHWGDTVQTPRQHLSSFILESGKGVSTGSISPVLRFTNFDLRNGKEASPDICLSALWFEPLTVGEALKRGRLSLDVWMRFPWLPL